MARTLFLRYLAIFFAMICKKKFFKFKNIHSAIDKNVCNKISIKALFELGNFQ